MPCAECGGNPKINLSVANLENVLNMALPWDFKVRFGMAIWSCHGHVGPIWFKGMTNFRVLLCILSCCHSEACYAYKAAYPSDVLALLHDMRAGASAKKTWQCHALWLCSHGWVL